MNIVLICTEKSGENLLHSYLSLIQQQLPLAHIYCQTSFDRFQREGLDRLPNLHFLADRSLCSVMGFLQPLKRLIPLWHRTRFLQQNIALLKPALLIGFDGPDFCLRLEKTAKALGAYTVHVVSPSVWAWRKGRVQTVEQSAHELHHLFAFEQAYYQKTALVTRHIGHPLLRPITPRLRTKNPKTLLLAPGSRSSEVKSLLPTLLKIALALKAQKKVSHILIAKCADLDPRLYPKDAPGITICEDFYSAIDQADFAIACSGTATLEIAAHGCPLIVLYSIAPWKHYLLSFFIQTPYISLPNIILNQPLLPEFLGNLQSLYPQILAEAEKSFAPSEYKEIAQNLYDKMTPVVLQEQAPCLSSILQQTFLQASMKPDEAL